MALKWIIEDKESVTISSDSKVTVGPVSYEARKIYPIILETDGKYVPLAVAGGAGEASLIKQGYRICERVLTDLAVREWDKRTPSFEQFEKAVECVESCLIKRFRELREHGIEPSFNMILASVDPTGKASMYLFDDRGLAEPVHDNPGFAVIGTGFVTGGNLLLRLLGYAAEESYAVDMVALPTFIIDVVSEIDPAVGPFVGESWFMRVEGKEVLLGPLKEEAIKDYKIRAMRRRDLMRRLWRLFDVAGEEKVEQVIRELEKEVLKEESSEEGADV